MAQPAPITSSSTTLTTSPIPLHTLSLISLSVTNQILLFGTYTLKSGRTSPYFFNSSKFCDAASLSALSDAFARSVQSSVEGGELGDFDVVFGPAYKGIPLAALVSTSLFRLDPGRYGTVGYTYNRKEVKDHGEGGSIVGMSLKGKRVLILDDVITSGKAIREAVEIIKGQGASIVGISVVLDRQEKGLGETSAVEDVERELGVKVVSVIKMTDIIAYLGQRGGSMEKELEGMQAYREKYGVV